MNRDKICLILNPITRSKAKFLKLFPLKSFIEGEEYEVSLQVANIGQVDFPGGSLRVKASWPSLQTASFSLPVIPLRKGEYTITSKFTSDVLCDGYCLLFVDRPDIRDTQGKPLELEFYSGRSVEDRLDTNFSISAIKAKTWEEIYEFWALIIAAISLLVIAIDIIIRWVF